MARTEFIGPAQGAEEPAKSKVRPSPSRVTARAMVSGPFTTPSLSTKAVERQVPSGMSAIIARICAAARVRISAMAAATVASP